MLSFDGVVDDGRLPEVFVPESDVGLLASLAENIRVSRLVIDGFSSGDTWAGFCGSDGGAACPLPLRFSVLGTAIPFCLTGFDSGEPIIDDACEAAGEACDRSVMRESLGALTVAMPFGGAALCTEEMMCGMEGSPPRRCGQGPYSGYRYGQKMNSRR